MNLFLGASLVRFWMFPPPCSHLLVKFLRIFLHFLVLCPLENSTNQTRRKHVHTLIGGTQKTTKKSPSVLSLGNAGPEISESPPAVFSLAPRLRRRFRGCVIYVHADVCVPVRVCVYRAGLFLFGSSGPPGSETWDDPPRGTRSSGGLPESLGLDVAEKLAVSATTCPPPLPPGPSSDTGDGVGTM